MKKISSNLAHDVAKGCEMDHVLFLIFGLPIIFTPPTASAYFLPLILAPNGIKRV